MLGRYHDFPTNIEGFARYNYQASMQTLQLAIVQALHSLNNQTIDIKHITEAGPASCSVSFEFGVADADTFNFLDAEELQRIRETLKQQTLPVLDVYFVARYHASQPEGKRRSLKFDYGMLRFAFGKGNMELFVYHERGTQRIPLDDLAAFLKDQINTQLGAKRKKTLTLKSVIKSQRMFSLQQP
jgi:hypothetical protein